MYGNREYGSAAVEPDDVYKPEEEMEPHIDPLFTEYDRKVRAVMEGREEEPERWTADWVGSWGKTRQFDILNQHGDTMFTVQLTEDDDMNRVLDLIQSAPKLQEEIENMKRN